MELGLSKLGPESRREVGQAWVTWPAESGCLPGTTTRMAPTSAPVSLTCSSWCTPSTGPRGPPTSLCPGGEQGQSPRVKRGAWDRPESREDKAIAIFVTILCAQLSIRKFSEARFKCGLSSWSIIFTLVWKRKVQFLY